MPFDRRASAPIPLFRPGWAARAGPPRRKKGRPNGAALCAGWKQESRSGLLLTFGAVALVSDGLLGGFPPLRGGLHFLVRLHLIELRFADGRKSHAAMSRAESVASKLHSSLKKWTPMADENQVVLLQQGVSEWNAWRKESESNRVIDLREANLSEANLRGADLNGADLRLANLNGADRRVKNSP